MTKDGLTPSTPSSPSKARAIPTGRNRWGAGEAVKPWPGRSIATTRRHSARRGAKPDHECVEAAVPCTSKATGPLPIS